MANKNMNLTASLRLNTKDFQNGINSVLKSIRGLRSTFVNLAGALGVGLGFSKIISEAKQTATELSIAMAVLENASKVTNEAGEVVNNYATNLEYVRKISRKYKQDYLALINTFAQFTAAANQVKDANGKIAIELDEQKYIYEQLTRAAAGYHMSADRTKDMMNAIVQMMSKGKVAAEELRRQLGNSLPGAFGMMAAAMGVSNAELEDMMRKGQVMTADALPKFARLLEGVTEHMTFDSLQNSTNELKNSWTELIEEVNLSATFKTLTDQATKFLTFIRKNIDNIVAWITGILSGGAVFSVLTGFRNKVTALNEGWIQQLGQVNRKYDILFKSVERKSGVAARAYEMMTEQGQFYFKGLSLGPGAKVDDAGFQKQLGEYIKRAKEANNQLLEMDKLQKKLGYQSTLTGAERKDIIAANKEFDKTLKTYRQIQEVNGVIPRGLQKIKGLMLEIGGAVKSILISTIVYAAISAVIGLVVKWRTHLKEVREEQERINSIVPDYENAMNKIATGTTQTAKNLKKLADGLKGMDTNSPEYASKIQEINKQLGLTGDAAFTIKTAYEDIVKQVDEWIDKQRAIAAINKALASQDEAMGANERLQGQLTELENDFFKKFGHYAAGYVDMMTGQWRKGATNDMSNREQRWIINKILPVIQEIRANTRKIELAEGDIAAQRNKLASKYGVDVTGDTLDPGKNNPGKNKGPKVDTPSSVMDDYLKKRKELENQYKNGAIPTEEKFKEKLEDLQIQTFETLAAFDEWDNVLKKLSKSSREEAEQLRASFNENYANKAARTKKDDGDKAAKKELEEVERQLKELNKYRVPKEGSRDSTFDYTKKPLEIQAEIADIKMGRSEDIQKLIDELKEGIVAGDFDKVIGEAVRKLFELVSALQQVKKEATDLKQKVKLAEAIEELDTKIKELQENSISNFTSLAQSLDRVNNSLLSIAEVFDEDLKDSALFKSYQAFSQVLNYSIQMFEAIGSVIQVVQSIQDLAAKKKVKDAAMEVAANQVATASEIEKATASASAAAAGGAASVASIPVVGPALAVAAAAAIIAGIIAAIGKFATGGIVGGNSYSGDKQVARVNSGEMILNRAQQRTLLDIANGKRAGSGGQVEFKIRGADLVGTLNNYNRLRS